MEKKRSVGVVIILVLIGLCLPALVFPEIITLKSGLKFEAKILKKTDQYIVVDWQGTQVRYLLDEVDKIGDESSPSEEDVESIDGELLRRVSEKVDTKLKYPFNVDNDSYINKELGISVIKPEGWGTVPNEIYEKRIIEGVLQDEKLFGKEEVTIMALKAILKNPKRIVNFCKFPFQSRLIYENPTVGIDVVDITKHPDVTALQYANHMVKSISGNFDFEFQVVEHPREIFVNDNKWVKVIWKLKVIGPSPWPLYIVGHTYREIRYYLKKDNSKILSLFAYSKDDDFYKTKEVFENILKSFQLE